MITVIKNATIVTGDAAHTVLYDSALAVKDTRITAVGPTSEVEADYPDAEQVDARGYTVFPGLVNCHTHLLATADRGILEDFGFPTTLRFPVGARSLLSTEERQVMATLNQSQGGNYMDSGIKTGLRVAEEFLGGFSFMYFSPWC